MYAMTEKQFLIEFSKYYKTICNLKHENRSKALMAFCEKEERLERLDMAALVWAISEMHGLVNLLEKAVDILTADEVEEQR